jgi:hypothetical protein
VPPRWELLSCERSKEQLVISGRRLGDDEEVAKLAEIVRCRVAGDFCFEKSIDVGAAQGSPFVEGANLGRWQDVVGGVTATPESLRRLVRR